MNDLLNRIASQDILPVVIVAIVFASVVLVALTVSISICVRTVRRDALTAQLKQDMLDRGMTPEEIKLVLEAGPKT